MNPFPVEPTVAAPADADDERVDRRTDDRRRRSGDRLTGLADRDTFARAVDQADRDRDRMIIAVVAVDGLAEINQLCGYDAGDSLLSALARVLAERGSVDLTVGRVGGSHLGLLQTPAGNRSPVDLVEPIADDLGLSVDRWLQDRAAIGTPCPIVPLVRIGVAAGHGGATWSDAEVALAVAEADPDGPPVVPFDLADARLAGHRRRQLLADEVAEALHRRRLAVEHHTVEPIERIETAATGRHWLRLVAHPTRAQTRRIGGRGSRDRLRAGDLALAPGLAGQLDRHLLERAVVLLDQRSAGLPTDPADRAGGPVAIPLLGPLGGPLSALSLASGAGRSSGSDVEGRRQADGASLIVEVDQDCLSASDRESLADRLAGLGWRLAISGFDGGWDAWSLIDALPVHHLRLRPDLVDGAIAGRQNAASLLATAGAAAADHGLLVVTDDHLAERAGATERLRELGVTHIDRP